MSNMDGSKVKLGGVVGPHGNEKSNCISPARLYQKKDGQHMCRSLCLKGTHVDILSMNCLSVYLAWEIQSNRII